MKKRDKDPAFSPPPKLTELPLFHICSHLGINYRERLDRLFFFNPHQYKVKDRVLYSVTQYGAPEIQSSCHSITLGIKNLQGAQPLFVLSGRKKDQLQAALLYVRENDRLIVLYLALNPRLTHNWTESCALLLFITQALRGIALRISGIIAIEFKVGNRISFLPITSSKQGT